MDDYNAHQFRSLLTYLPLAYTSAHQIDRINEDFRTALLVMASETPDNLAGVNGVEVGTATTRLLSGKKEYHFGLKVKDKNVRLSDLLYELGNGPMPEAIREAYPELNELEWHTASRIIYLVMQSFDTMLKKPV